MSRIILTDIENYDLHADLGVLLCVGWKEVGKKKIHCPGIWDFKGWGSSIWDDRGLVKHVSEEFADADAFVTHYGAPPHGHDIKYLNSKICQYGFKTLPPAKQIDVWRLARSYLKLHSNRQDSICEFLGTPRKKRPGWQLWKRVLDRDEKAYEEMKSYCKRDVRGLEENFLKLRPFAKNIPNMNLDKNVPCCANCGSGHIIKRGFHITKVNKYQRFQCQDCGSWSHGNKKGVDLRT